VWVLETVGKCELALEAVRVDGITMVLVEHFERNGAVRFGGIVGSVNRGGSTVTNDTVDHVILEAVVGQQHALRVGFGGVLHAAAAPAA
jgi:hypothetical protein